MGNETSVDAAPVAGSAPDATIPAAAAAAPPTLDLSFYTPRAVKVTVCAVGVGSRLRSLLRRLLSQFGDAIELVAMCDVQAATRQTREKLGVVVERAIVYDMAHYEEMLATHKPNWVMVGSQNNLHCQHVLAAFNHGAHVFCEKPIATTAEDCWTLVKAQRASGLLFATGFVLRYTPLFEKLRDVLPLVGKVVTVEMDENLLPFHGGYIMTNWRRYTLLSGSHLAEKCCHDIDYICALLNDLPHRVYSAGSLASFTRENQPADEHTRSVYRMWSEQMGWEPHLDPFTSDKDIVDNQAVMLQMRKGATVNFTTNSNSAFSQRRCNIYGTRGTICSDFTSCKLKVKTMAGPVEKFFCSGSGAHSGGDVHIVAELARSMLTGSTPICDAVDGLKSTIIALAADESRISGQAVDLEPTWHKFGF